MGGYMSSNMVYESADKYVGSVSGMQVGVRNPDDYITKLDDISSPDERLKTLFKSVVNITTEPTYEAMWIRKFAIVGFMGGFFTGAYIHSPDVHMDYIRKHNASVFEGKYVGNRHFWDTLVAGCSARGFKYGFRSCALTTAVAVIGIGSITYRSKLYLPDWLIGYTALGAISRLWLGPRAMLAGGVICMSLGSVAYGLLNLLQIASGTSVSEMEYMSHKQWLDSRQLLLNRNHLRREELLMERAQQGMDPSAPSTID